MSVSAPSALIAFLFLGLMTSESWAQVRRSSQKSYEGVSSESHHQIGLVADNWKYNEPRIQDSGILFGVHYRYQSTLYDFIKQELHLEYLTGDTQYDGAEIDTNNPISMDQSNKIYNGYWLVLLDLNNSSLNTFRFLPFVGFYYRYLVDANDPFNGDYEREQTYMTMPVGFNLHINQWKIQALFHFIFTGENITHFGDVGGTPAELTFKQDTGDGLQFEVERSFGSFSFTGFFRSWDVEASDSQIATLPAKAPSYYEEPVNSTVSYGMRFNYNF